MTPPSVRSRPPPTSDTRWPAPSPRAARAQTAPLGVVLILVIVVFGTVAIVLTGGTAIADAQRESELARAEQALTQFDARAAQVALGESTSQSIPLGPAGSGQFDVVEDAGWLRVVHHDYAPGRDETVFNGTLGALVYRHGDASVAYQGGGVWRADEPNASVMVAPPEFHYRAATLVLPVVDVRGEDAASGSRRALVTREGLPVRVFPDEGTGGPGVGAPYDGTGDPYANPVRGGNVTVTVQSDYYHAWGRFFETRTQGDVTMDHAHRRVTIELDAPKFVGEFRMPDEGGAIPIRGIVDAHAVERFELDLAPDDADSADFNNLQWSLHAENGRQEFELHLRLTGPANDPATDCKEQDIAATVYYSDTNGNDYHGWHEPRAFQTSCTDRDGDGDEDEVRLAVNLTSDVQLSMRNLQSSDLQYVNPQGATRLTSVTFDEHAATVGWEPRTFTDGGLDEAGIGDLLDHYLGLLGPDYDLVVDDKSSNTVDEATSSGVLEYGARGRVTYIHVSANVVHIALA